MIYHSTTIANPVKNLSYSHSILLKSVQSQTLPLHSPSCLTFNLSFSTKIQSNFEMDQHLQKEEKKGRKHSYSFLNLSVRYCYWSGCEKMFTLKVEKDFVEEDVHPLVKAVRLYLDIIYFHPFEDGCGRWVGKVTTGLNSFFRAAMLWLWFFCVRFGMRFPKDVGPFIILTCRSVFTCEEYWVKISVLLKCMLASQ